MSGKDNPDYPSFGKEYPYRELNDTSPNTKVRRLQTEEIDLEMPSTPLPVDSNDFAESPTTKEYEFSRLPREVGEEINKTLSPPCSSKDKNGSVSDSGVFPRTRKVKRPLENREWISPIFQKFLKFWKILKRNEISLEAFRYLGFRFSEDIAEKMGLSTREIAKLKRISVICEEKSARIMLTHEIPNSLLLDLYLSLDPKVTLTVQGLKALGVKFTIRDLVGQRSSAREKINLLIRSGLVVQNSQAKNTSPNTAPMPEQKDKFPRIESGQHSSDLGTTAERVSPIYGETDKIVITPDRTRDQIRMSVMRTRQHRAMSSADSSRPSQIRPSRPETREIIDLENFNTCLNLYRKNEITHKALSCLGFRIPLGMCKNLGMTPEEIEALSQKVSINNPIVATEENAVVNANPEVTGNLLIWLYISGDQEVHISLRAIKTICLRLRIRLSEEEIDRKNAFSEAEKRELKRLRLIE